MLTGAAASCANRAAKKQFHELTCYEKCVDALNNYYKLISGARGQRIRHGERWLDRADADPAALKEFYQILYASCPDAQADPAIPDLDAGLSVDRGCKRTGMFC